MGKSIALAMPFILAMLIFLGWLLYRAGKKVGERTAPQRGNLIGSKLLLDADQIFSDLMFIESVDNDDIITIPTQKRINTWRMNYVKAKNQ